MQTQLHQLRALHVVKGQAGFPLLGLSPAEQAAPGTPRGPLALSKIQQDQCAPVPAHNLTKAQGIEYL